MRIFSYHWIIQKKMGKVKTILDVGCGNGSFMKIINKNGDYKATGIDLYKPHIQTARRTKSFERLISADIRKIEFEEKSFDLVISSQVVEHLEKKEAKILIKKMEKIAKKKIIVATTNGYFPFDPIEGKDDNPFQVHKCGWTVSEFKRMGYKVYGQGLGFVYKPNKFFRIPILKYLFFIFSYIVSPVVYLFPRLSAYIIAVKEL